LQILFSTLFDQRTYPENIFMQNGVSVGNRHMGPLALLDFLELHLGIPGSCTNKIERIFNYRKNLHKNANGSFYEKSLQTNDLEVAIKLLGWRDELKTAGWDFKTNKSCPSRLKDLAKVEEVNVGTGDPERFCKIIDALKEKPKLPLRGIIVHEPPELLPSHLTQLFALLAAAGVTIKQREVLMQKTIATDLDKLRCFVLDKNASEKKTALNADGSIQVIKFGDMLSAGKGLAALIAANVSFRPVIINESRDISLSLSLGESGLPSTGQAMQSATHPDLQLLAIVPVWLWKPYDPQQVLDFFLSPLNIFPKGLSGKWLGLFSENPGISIDDWLEEMEEYLSNTGLEQEKPKYKERLDLLLNIAQENTEKLPAETIINYYNFYHIIFKKRCAVTTDEQLKARLQRLCNAFKGFINVLELAPEKKLNLFGLQKLLRLVLQPVSIIPFEREAGSLHEISTPGLLVEDCNDLLSFGFTANKTESTLWDEWTTEELEWLRQQQIFPDTSQLISKRDFWFLTHWLQFVKKRLILIIPSIENGEAVQPHPFHPFLKACFANLHSITINVELPSDLRLLDTDSKLTEKIAIHPIPAFPVYWQIKGDLLTKRAEESYNSLENLMKYPYRWVLSYKAKLYRGETFSLPDKFIFYGNLSHKIFQKLLLMPGILKMSKNQLNQIYSITAKEFIDQKGLLLHTQGEESNLKLFREDLFEKFWILRNHLHDNNWQVEGCEIKGSGQVGEVIIGGFCDLLLKRIKGKTIEKAIVDLKYSGRSKYRRLMQDGEDFQLAIYSKIFHQAAGYCPTSYFIISDGSLFTTCKAAFGKGIILRYDGIYTNTYADVLKRIGNTVKFRRNEFRKGKIEVGENILTEELDIFQLDMTNYIIPRQEKKSKCRSLYNDYLTFIDTE
jgi:ATP-dependent helicase/nuclease subunit B